MSWHEDAAVTGRGGVDRRTALRNSTALATGLLIGGATAVPAHAGDKEGRPSQPSAEGITLHLPAPTGPHRTGVTTLHLVDHRRGDPWDAGLRARELMVTVHYPAARATAPFPLAPHMTPVSAQRFATFDPVYLHPQLPKNGVNWGATMTRSRAGAPAQPVRRPVLLYSPGGCDPRTLGTGLAEELASHGAVVVTIDHPGEPGAVEFPDGSVRQFALPGTPDDPQVFRTMLHTRIADTRFVLDALTSLADGHNPDASARPLPENLHRALDLHRVGVYGHSVGGETAAEALYEDRRIAAAANLEGYLDYPPQRPGEKGELLPVTRHGVDRPLLLLGTDGFRNARFDRSWSAMLRHPHGHTRRHRLHDANHWIFTDYAALAPQLQDAGLMTAPDRAALIGALPPDRSVPAVRHRVRTFFARHLDVR
ncbi:alpha/beta hydrolase [Streptomyces sp. NPDC059009]|uniref:alpha/beta hydrolase n=1 Tax=Streptomyces sp. NPDC059009 TaxID=3346694 RepID=UPI00367FE676